LGILPIFFGLHPLHSGGMKHSSRLLPDESWILSYVISALPSLPGNDCVASSDGLYAFANLSAFTSLFHNYGGHLLSFRSGSIFILTVCVCEGIKYSRHGYL
jgi:hypothetical protein